MCFILSMRPTWRGHVRNLIEFDLLRSGAIRRGFFKTNQNTNNPAKSPTYIYKASTKILKINLKQ